MKCDPVFLVSQLSASSSDPIRLWYEVAILSEVEQLTGSSWPSQNIVVMTWSRTKLFLQFPSENIHFLDPS